VLKSAFGEKTPACLVYKAGYSNSEKVIRTDLEGLEEAARQEKEKFLGMIYVGKSLQ
jgi:precorrin-4 methylase